MYFKNIFGAFQLNSFPRGGVHLPCHDTSPMIYSKLSQTKICKRYQYEESYKPPRVQMCIEMRGKWKFQMALNHLKIDFLEIFRGDR